MKKLQECKETIRKQIDFRPKVALVLGSGLGNYAEHVETIAEIPYTELPGFPVSIVQGHDGKFIFGYVHHVPVVLMKGRVHYYEGYEMSDVVLPIRLMRMLGADILILTNAAGGSNPSLGPGDLMLIEDQIASFVPSPLRGRNLDTLGERFPDMSEIYDLELRRQAEMISNQEGIALKKGVYLQTSGPNYESPAEIQMYRRLGADAIGMSTACEAVAARHMGMKVCGISCISNMAAGILGQPLNHKEVQEVANQVQDKFVKLITAIIRQQEDK